MTNPETQNVLDEIESLVSDQLRVVSYKWLSRNLSISSKTAKSLLKDFVEKQGKDFEVVYTVSGWLKKEPSDYHTRLVSTSKLTEVEKEFNGTCSVHIYSVQASIPMDPAAIWNTEFVQAEELFKQPLATNNCLRDNRFCGISNSFVKRNIEGDTENDTMPSNQEKKSQQSVPTVGHQQPKSETNTVLPAPTLNQSVKSLKDKEKSVPVPANKKNVSGTGGSLKNMWGRVPVKTEDDEVKKHDPSAQKPLSGAENKEEDSIDERRGFKNGNRKRKVIFDFSDEEEDVISLPSPPTSPKIREEPRDLDQEKKPNDAYLSREIKTEKPDVSKADRHKPPASAVRKTEKTMASSMSIGSEAQKGRTTDAPSSPKRKKVVKTRIDDRGREVTEVVWEDTETNTKKKEDITDTSKKANDGKSANAVINKAVAQKKTPAIGNAAATNAGGKGGSKKGNVKDPKQGNIMSFFKKKV